jgi:hypothetical protein
MKVSAGSFSKPTVTKFNYAASPLMPPAGQHCTDPPGSGQEHTLRWILYHKCWVVNVGKLTPYPVKCHFAFLQSAEFVPIFARVR